MAHEIEKKYLLLSDQWQSLPTKAIYEIIQGYINKNTTAVDVRFSKKGKTVLTFRPLENDKAAKPVSLTVKYNKKSSFAGLAKFFARNNQQDGDNLMSIDAADCRFRLRKNEKTGKKEAFITIKASTNVIGISEEFEEKVDMDMAKTILEIYGQYTVYKTRHVIPVGSFDWEVDVFKEQLKGLTMAEIEVGSVDEFDRVDLLPDLGAEVTEDKRYTNKSLGRYGLPS